MNHNSPVLKNPSALLFLMLVFLCLLWGCPPPEEKPPAPTPSLIPVETGMIPDFLDSMGLDGLKTSVENSLVYLNRAGLNKEYQYGLDTVKAGDLIASFEGLNQFLAGVPSPLEMNAFIRSHFKVYTSRGSSDPRDDTHSVIFTGYYEPTYKGSIEKKPPFTVPVYSFPDDLFQIDLSLFSDEFKGRRRLMARVDEQSRRIKPYFSRSQINTMPDFEQHAPPVLWLENRVDRFFLEIQGSGRISLENGDIVRLHYAGSNGNAYSSIGRYLIAKK